MHSKLHESIQQTGWHVLKVMEDETGPGFTYSLGLFHSFQHSEIIIVGLSLDLAHNLINNMGEEVRKGQIFESGQFYPSIIEGFECLFIEVSKENYHDYVVQAQEYYGSNEFPLLQCVYLTTKGIYPWQEEWPEEIRGLQPLLGELDNYQDHLKMILHSISHKLGELYVIAWTEIFLSYLRHEIVFRIFDATDLASRWDV